MEVQVEFLSEVFRSLYEYDTGLVVTTGTYVVLLYKTLLCKGVGLLFCIHYPFCPQKTRIFPTP